jgi:hypothetical protein
MRHSPALDIVDEASVAATRLLRTRAAAIAINAQKRKQGHFTTSGRETAGIHSTGVRTYTWIRNSHSTTGECIP